MPALKNLNHGFAAGVVGIIPLLILLFLLNTQGKGPPITLELIYRDVTWGGLWGLLLALPWLVTKWWARGLVLGIAAAIVLIVFFIPSGAPLDAVQIMLILVLHIVWGLATAYWYRLAGQ